MTNFTVKNHFKAENAKLVDATVYQVENGTWYMELQYEYEDESGIHRRYYPKVEFPFFYGKLPPEEFSSDRFGRDELTISLITKLGKENLCPTCLKAYKRFVEELMDSWKKRPTINLSKSINISKGETTNA